MMPCDLNMDSQEVYALVSGHQMTPSFGSCCRSELCCTLKTKREDLTLLQSLSAAAQGEKRECAFTDQQQQSELDRVAGGEGRVSPENTTIRCTKGEHCFGLWEKSPPGDVRLVKQGSRIETEHFVCLNTTILS